MTSYIISVLHLLNRASQSPPCDLAHFDRDPAGLPHCDIDDLETMATERAARHVKTVSDGNVTPGAPTLSSLRRIYRFGVYESENLQGKYPRVFTLTRRLEREDLW